MDNKDQAEKFDELPVAETTVEVVESPLSPPEQPVINEVVEVETGSVQYPEEPITPPSQVVNDGAGSEPKASRPEFNCIPCQGEGLVNGAICSACKGTGKVETKVKPVIVIKNGQAVVVNEDGTITF